MYSVTFYISLSYSEFTIYVLTFLYPEFPVGAAGCWTPFPADQPQELELFLFSKYVVMSVTTQGAPDKPEWVTKYRVSYRIDATSFWQYMKKEDGSEVNTGHREN